MQIISVSMGTYGGGKDLAHRLAAKMGYPCLGREDLIEAATREGIQVGKLEMAMIKPRAFTERLARERDHYLAFSRAYLCGKAMDGDLVYYGRTGHLLLPGITHVMKVRVVWDLEHRVQTIMNSMGLERKKALRYVQEVDEDRARWVRSMYGIALEEATNYDVTVNLQQLSVESAAAGLVAMAQLPDFQMTPASRQAMEDLLLGANARLALARDKQTFSANLKVRADRGIVTVNYTPQDSGVARAIPSVLQAVSGIRDLRITMATANILWIQERFQPGADQFRKVLEIATKWNAAVELLRLAPEEERPEGERRPGVVPEPGVMGGPAAGTPAMAAAAEEADAAFDGGIEADDTEDVPEGGGLQETLDELAEAGRSGGGRSVYGGRERLVEAMDRTIPYTLVVLGDLFLSRGHQARQRAVRDLRSFLGDRVRAPVVTAEELESEYLFGRRDFFRASFFLALTVVAYVLVFTNQEAILAFLANTGWYAEAARGTFLGRAEWLPRIVVSLVILVVVPAVAFAFGEVARTFLKLIKME